MKHNYLEVTFRKGQPLAAYYYLPRRDDDKVVRTERVGGGLLVDYTVDGRAIGIEISAPAQLELSQLNRVLADLGQPTVAPEDLAPLAAA